MSTATTEVAIWLALKSRIQTLPFEPPLPVAWPAMTYRPNGKPFLAVGRVSVAPTRVLVGKGAHERRGSITISYVAPLGPDMAVHDQAAGIIAAHFADDTRMRFGAVCVRVPSYPHVDTGFRDDAYWRVPVIVPWISFA